MVVVLTDNK